MTKPQNEERPLRVLITDDHEVVRRGVRALLSGRAAFDVCGEAVDGRDALAKAQQLKPDVIIMDVSMPHLNGLEATREIRRILPETQVLMLSQHNVPEMMNQALKAGASGYVVKSAISVELIDALEKLRSRQSSFGKAAQNQANVNMDTQEILQRSAAYEKALRESEERFRLAQEIARIGTFEWNLKTGVNRWTPELEGLYGLGAGEFAATQRAWEELVHPADRTETLAKVTRALKEGAFEGEWRVVWPDGSVHWLLGRAWVFRDETGEPERLLGVNIEITERKMAEEASREGQRQLALALTSSKTALFEWDLIRGRGKWNAHLAAIYGFTPEEEEIDTEGWKRLLHLPPEEIANLEKEAEEAIATKDEFAFEFRAVRPDGSLRWVLSKGRVVRDGEGQALRLIGTHMDITDRKTAEEALAKGARRQAAIAQLAERLHRAKTLDDVYGAAFDALAGALQCERASILLYDERGLMRFVGWRGLSEGYRQSTEGHSPWQREESDPQPVCIADVSASEIKEPLKTIVLGEGIRALAFIPLVSQEKLIGKFMVYYEKAHDFGADEIEVSLTIGRQVAFGIEKKRAENALQESMDHSRAIVETTPECVKLVAADGTLLHMNSAGLRMVGADRADMAIGKNVYELIAPKDRDRFREFNARVCEGKKGSLEFEIVGLKGVRRHMESHSAPLRQPDGSIVQLGVTRDITKRKQAEEALSRLAAIVQCSDDAIISKDLKGIITSWNPAAERIFGFRRDEAVGQPITIIIPPELREEEQLILSRVRAGQRMEHYETVRRTKTGTTLYVSLTISPMRDAHGHIIGASKIARDITERKLAEHILKEAELSGRLLQLQDEERRHMARELHDGVGQLLAAMGMNTATVAREKEKLSGAAVRCVEQNGEMIEEIIAEIRTMSHLLHPPLLDEVGLRSALKEYVSGFGERSSIAVTLEVSEALERLPREWELSLFRIVQECLTNIHRHSGSTTAVVRLARTAEEIQLEVEDQGRGIPAEVQEKFFAGTSSGVGLRGMRERVRRIGGSLQLYSRGKGTSVRVVLPAAQNPGIGERREAAAQAAKA